MDQCGSLAADRSGGLETTAKRRRNSGTVNATERRVLQREITAAEDRLGVCSDRLDVDQVGVTGRRPAAAMRGDRAYLGITR